MFIWLWQCFVDCLGFLGSLCGHCRRGDGKGFVHTFRLLLSLYKVSISLSSILRYFPTLLSMFQMNENVGYPRVDVSKVTNRFLMTIVRYLLSFRVVLNFKSVVLRYFFFTKNLNLYKCVLRPRVTCVLW